MRVLVVGAGAVGSWIGGALALGGAEVVLAEPGPHRQVIVDRGLTIETAGRRANARPAVAASITEACDRHEFDLAVVAVKSYHTAAVATELGAAGAPARVASFQNGIGNDSVLGSSMPEASLVAATLTTGLQIDFSTCTVSGAEKGGVGIGLTTDGPPLDDLVAHLAAGGIEVRTYEDPSSMKWSKLLLNVLGSATCALMSWPPARVFSDRRLFGIEHRAWMEAAEVVRSLGLEPVGLPGYPVHLFVRGARFLPPSLSFRLFAGRLAGARGDRLPSVAADLAAGRHSTENNVLSGAVARTSREVGVDARVTRVLSDLVDGIASGEIDRQAFVDRPDELVARIAATP